MPDEGTSTVACGACGKKYPRSAAVDRRFKCTCGTITHLPSEAAPSAQPEDDYELAFEAPAPPKPGPRGSSVSEAVKTRMGAVPVAKPMGPDPEAIESARKLDKLLAPSPIRDWIIPAILLVIGLLLCTYDVMHADRAPATLAKAIPFVVLRVILSMGLVVGAIFLATAFFDVVVLGSFRNSIFRLCAIAVAPSAIYGVLVYTIGDVGGAAAGTFASVGLYALLYFLLMRMDLKDTAVCVIITFVLVTMVNYFIYKYQSASSGSWI